MATQKFYGKISHEDGTAADDGVTKSQLDAGVADAKARANHTGTQTASTISDLAAAVDARVQLIVDSAPAALDTLNELAAALGDDPNFAGTVTTALGGLDTRLDTLEAAGPASVHKQTFGGTATQTITHNLGTVDVAVEVVQVSNGQTVYPVVTRPTTNTVLLDFGATTPAASSLRVLVRKV